MAFPEKQPTSLRKKVGAVFDYLTGHESEKDLVIPNHEQVQEECLHIYLENHRRLLTSLDFSKNGVTFSMCVKEIFCIFQQLRIQSLCTDHRPSGENRIAKHLTKVLYNRTS